MITCEKFDSKESGALIGFADLTLTSGMIIRSCSVFRKDGRMWVSFPSRKYEDQNGETKYFNYVIIPDAEKYKLFQQAAIEAVKEKMEETTPVVEEPPQVEPVWAEKQEVLPF